MEAASVGSAAQIAEAAPLIAALLSLPTERYPVINLSPQKRKEKTFDALAGQIEARSRQEPVLMEVEDVHWIDPTSQEFLDFLVQKVRGLPVVLLMTHRLEYVPPWTGQTSVTTVTLNRLGREQVAQLVSTVTKGKVLPTELLDEILSRTDGVPLFVEEMTRSVLESGQLRMEGDRYVLQGPLAALAIPSSLRDLLTARLNRLGSVKEFAQTGACIGREFSHELLDRIARRSNEVLATSLQSSLEALISAEMITREGTGSDTAYTFKHALIQDAAYDSLLKSTRTELHARIAHVLEDDFADLVANSPEWLAHHHTQAGHLARAIPLWRRAGTVLAALWLCGAAMSAIGAGPASDAQAVFERRILPILEFSNK